MGLAMGFTMKGYLQDKIDRREKTSLPMNCLSVNVQGIGNRAKVIWLCKQCDKYKVNFMIAFVRSLWGNPYFDFHHMTSRGKSGGILVAWEPRRFAKELI
ncbi:hypothetical protein LXL04_019901 [Taraxacum kok-saghyz]